MRLLFVAALSMLASAPARAETAGPDLSWMSGYWLSCANGRQVSETWSDVRGKVMLGNSFTLKGGKPSWEFSRIGPSAKGYSFFAQPDGQGPAEFPAVEVAERRVVFENPAHDFPQRVIYQREGDRLHGRIEGTVNGSTMNADWHYDLAPLNARCSPADPAG